ncbi:MAG: hypothetical protein SFU83_00445 [Meiothermus sp.]|nr:hypothetical protein [Meiothermus sp.]
MVSLFAYFVLGVWDAGAASALWIHSNNPALYACAGVPMDEL